MKFFITLFMIIFSYSSMFAILNNLVIDEPQEQIEFDQNGNKIAYTIIVPGKRHSDGRYSLAKMYKIPVLPDGEYLSNTIHIKTKSNFSFSERKSRLPQMLSSTGLKIEPTAIEAPYEKYHLSKYKEFDTDGISKIYKLSYAGTENPYDVCKELMKNPDVEYAVPIFNAYYHDYTPNDPKISSQWGLVDIEAFKAWDISKGDSSVIIAITDSGVDYNHEDLKDNIWINPNEIPGDSIDNDNNGYVDDFRGWDMVGNVSISQAASGQYKEDNDPKPGHWHGTHVSGCAAEVGDNGKGGVGPGFKCKILPIKCGIDNSQSKSIFRGYDAILYAAEMGAHVINCSWGGPGGSPAAQEIINTAYNMGSVVAVSAGNSYKNIDYGNSYPAGYDNVLCVGATRSNDRKAWFSNYGHLVTVYGPGQGIYATMPNNSYGNQQGTSMSCPVVSGICGQLIAEHPDWTPRQIMHQIRSTSEPLNENESLKPIYYGKANAYRALSYNNPNLGDYERIPGLSISDIVSEKDVLTDFTETTLQLEITNYLSTARRTRVRIKPLQNYLYVSNDEEYIGTLEGGSSTTFDLNVRLLDVTPWFEGLIDILVEFESDDYVDYQLIQIPLKLESKNEFSLSYIFPEEYLPQWYSAESTGFDNLFLVGSYSGTGNGIFYKYGSQYNPNGITQFPLYSVFSPDGNQIYAGSGGDKTEVIKSTNGGAQWTSTDVSDITRFINGIYFFDNMEGVIAGDPHNGEWGVARTTNGGQDWSRVYNIDDPLSGEAGFLNCEFGKGKSFWFGTNKGRIFLTKDRGKNWTAKTLTDNGFVHYIYFVDEAIGLSLYSDAGSSQVKVAYTANGGNSWATNKYDFGDIGVTPFYLYSPDNSKTIVAICKGGEIYQTTNYGNTWQPILNQKYSTITYAAAYATSGEGRVWAGESDLWKLDFEYLPDNPRRILTVEGGSTVDYGDISAGKSKTQNITLTNDGNMTIHIDSIVIVPIEGIYEDEFDITFPVGDEIESEASKNMRVKFYPQKAGLREANLIIYSDAEDDKMILRLKGNTVDAEPKLSFVTDSIYVLDSIEINTTVDEVIEIKNSGNILLEISSIELTGDEDFTIEADENISLLQRKSADINLTFNPTTVGEKHALLRVITDETESELNIVGIAIEPVSVDESIEKTVLSDVIPNPVIDNIKFYVNSKYAQNCSIEIVNLNGEKQYEVVKKLETGSNLLILNCAELLSGNYIMNLKVNDKILTKKFVVLR